MGETEARFPQDVLRAVIVDADTVDFHTDLAEKFRFDFKGIPNSGNGEIPSTRYQRIERYMPLKEAHTEQHPVLGASIYKIKALINPITAQVTLHGYMVIGAGFGSGLGKEEWYWDFDLDAIAGIRPKYDEAEPIQEVGSATLYWPGIGKVGGWTEMTTNIGSGKDGLRVVIQNKENGKVDFIGATHPYPWVNANGPVKGAKLRWSVEYEGIIS